MTELNISQENILYKYKDITVTALIRDLGTVPARSGLTVVKDSDRIIDLAYPENDNKARRYNPREIRYHQRLGFLCCKKFSFHIPRLDSLPLALSDLSALSRGAIFKPSPELLMNRRRRTNLNCIAVVLFCSQQTGFYNYFGKLIPYK